MGRRILLSPPRIIQSTATCTLSDEYDDKFNRCGPHRLVRLPSRIYSVEPSANSEGDSGSNSDEDEFSRRFRFIIRIYFSHFGSNSDGDSFGYGMSWWKDEHFNALDVDANGLLNLAEFNEYLLDIELLPIIGKLHPSGHLWKNNKQNTYFTVRLRRIAGEAIMDSRTQYDSFTVEDVFQDFKSRRTGLIKALTTDADDLYNQCDPDKENLCLYGFPNEEWKVTLPDENIPSELPEPSLGINFARSGMQKIDWLSLVATHSDSWLFGIAFCYGGQYGFNKSDRERLFSMINELPTILEVVDAAKKQVEEKSSVSNLSGSKSKSYLIAAPESQVKELEEEEDDESILCEVCSMHYGQDTFWIFCDFCEHWYHGKCVEVTPDMAHLINEYKCPFCRIQFD